MYSFFKWFFIGLFCWPWETAALEKVHVAVGQIVEHPALDMVREGLKKGLEEAGFMEGKNLIWTYENAQGNLITATQIGYKLTSLDPKPNVIVTLSTPMTQAVISSTADIPVVFGAVSDPLAAKLTDLPNVTGLTDFVPPEKPIDLMMTILPHVKKIGVIFNSGEANSQVQVEKIKTLCAKLGIEVVESTISKSAEVSAATKSLVGRVDAILLPLDNTVITALEAILKIGNENKIPIFGSDVDIVRRGALAAYGVDWHDSGLTLAEMVTKILRGTPLKDLPIQNPNDLVLYVNLQAAEKMGIPIPESVQKQADKVF
jgi:putative ABC transport system substrate-binding protein